MLFPSDSYYNTSIAGESQHLFLTKCLFIIQLEKILGITGAAGLFLCIALLFPSIKGKNGQNILLVFLGCGGGIAIGNIYSNTLWVQVAAL